MYNKFKNLKDIPKKELMPGFTGRLIHTDQISVSIFEIQKGSVLPEHQHIHEQTSIVQKGDFEFTVNGVTKIVTEGDFICIAPDTPHSAVALTDCIVMDIFSPVREDYK